MKKRTGVFVCHCGINIAGTVDVKNVAEELMKHSDVAHSEDYVYMCSDPGQKLIENSIKEHNLDSVVVSCCSPNLHETTFRNCAKAAGINEFQCEIANIREQCSWVHKDKLKATEKAKKITRSTVERVVKNKSLEPISIPVTRRGLVIGGGIAGIQAALDMANSGYEVVLVEKSPSIGGHMIQLSETFHHEGMDTEVLAAFGIDPAPKPQLQRWHQVVDGIRNPEGEVTIAVVGKYTGLKDAYKSLIEALQHGGIANRVRVKLDWIEAEVFEQEDPAPYLERVNGILVPGGFGERGAEGKIAAARFARERNVPYFGICFGMQMAVIEAARTLAGIEKAGSTEFGETSEPVVGLMTEWLKGNELEQRAAQGDLGGTMRLGAYKASLKSGSRIAAIYGDTDIEERHRHRYEVNRAYREALEAVGMSFAGMSPDGLLPETVELADHPWFIGVQYHPELKSRPFEPHPLFASFIAAAVEQSRLV